MPTHLFAPRYKAFKLSPARKLSLDFFFILFAGTEFVLVLFWIYGENYSGAFASVAAVSSIFTGVFQIKYTNLMIESSKWNGIVSKLELYSFRLDNGVMIASLGGQEVRGSGAEVLSWNHVQSRVNERLARSSADKAHTILVCLIILAGVSSLFAAAAS